MAEKYHIKWSNGYFSKANAEKVYSEIETIGNSVTPQQILDYAKNNTNSELNKCFEWNNDVAAEKYRLYQAGQIIRSLYVVPEEKEVSPLRILSKTSELHTYEPTVKFLNNTTEYDDLLKRAKAELESFRKKYKSLTELEEIFNAIDLL